MSILCASKKGRANDAAPWYDFLPAILPATEESIMIVFMIRFRLGRWKVHFSIRT